MTCRACIPGPLLVLFGTLAACSADDGPREQSPDETASSMRESDCTRTLAPSDDDQTALQGALIDAQSGDILCLGAGTYKLTGQLSLGNDGVTLRGTSGTVLDFSEQASGANGIELTGANDTLESLRIENPQGDGVRATNVIGPTFRKLEVVWTNGPDTANGGYGIYPVMSERVLIEECFVSGASDAGIYVGQSSQIIVRDNEVTGNVAGIEIENSTDAEVYSNAAHGNTGGILVFNLPGLAVKDGKRANLHDNAIEDNNLENFAAAGNIVADLPVGTGVFVLAADDNEIHDNVIAQHRSSGVSLISWHLSLRNDEGEMDPDFDWYPERNYVHDNELTDNGYDPEGNATLIAGSVGVTQLADLIWDGIIDSDKLDSEVAPEPGAVPPEELRNCFTGNGNATFYNLDFEHGGAGKSEDVTPYGCERAALPAIEL